MELEGLGVGLHGRPLWVYAGAEHSRFGSGIPWEYIQEINYSTKILIRGPHSLITTMETDWTSVWCPQSARDWSCIATLIRSIGVGSCLLVLDHVPHNPPASFWTYLDGIVKEGRTTLTRIWIHSEVPMWVPDAVFLPPLQDSESSIALQILQAMPARHNHGAWVYMQPANNWLDIIRDTRRQGLGLVLSDVQETAWTLFWHKPVDSRMGPETVLTKASAWLDAGTLFLKTHNQSVIYHMDK
jgi:hypothetical protein